MCVVSGSDLISDTIVSKGYWHDCPGLLSIWEMMKGESPDLGPPVFLDIGANIGSCSLLMLNAQAKVVSFEPLPHSLYYYSRSVLGIDKAAKRNNLTLFNVGCGKDYAQEKIFVARNNAGNAIIGKYDGYYDVNASIPISIVPCDDALWPGRLRGEKPPHIALLKLDVEGFEPLALQGLKHLLGARAIRAIKTEISPKLLKLHGFTAGEFCNMLRMHGFTLFLPGSDREFTATQCYEYNNKDKKIFDLVAFLNPPPVGSLAKGVSSPSPLLDND